MKIEDFGVEIWMNATETRCRYNLAETCVDSLTLQELLDLCGKSESFLGDTLPMKLTYGAIEGSDRLRNAIAGMYQGRDAHEVLVTHGAIGANALLYQTLIEPGDEIVSVLPTYQQHYSIAESLGATVKRLRLRPENGYLPDLEELSAMVTPRTKLIALTNPNNPTGALMDRRLLQGVADLAARHGAWVICDEVYRGVNQADDELTPSIAEIYPLGIAVGSMSKAFALAGLRLGWIVAPDELLRSVMIHRDYNHISVGMLDDYLAALALEHRDAVLGRNRQIVRTNLAILTDWMAEQPLLSWVRPAGGTVSILKYDLDIDSHSLCTKLLTETGVLVVPGIALTMEGTIRLGFGNGTETLKAGLPVLGDFLRSYGKK